MEEAGLRYLRARGHLAPDDGPGVGDENDRVSWLGVNTQERADPHVHARLLHHLAPRCILHPLSRIHVARGEAPCPSLRFMAATAKEDLAIAGYDHGHRHLG